MHQPGDGPDRRESGPSGVPWAEAEGFWQQGESPGATLSGSDADHQVGIIDSDTTDPEPADAPEGVHATLKGKVIDEWYWAASHAGIPQVWDVKAESSAPVPHARVTAVLRDGDEIIARKTIHDGPLPAGTTSWDSVHLNLSPTYMVKVDERRSALVDLTLDSMGSGRSTTLHVQTFDVDIQPRDLYNWVGDPRLKSLQELLDRTPWDERAQIVERRQEIETLTLSRALLASFVRPNHPDVARIARDAASIKLSATGDGGFHASQVDDPAAQTAEIESSVTAVYQAIQRRRLSYSEPPPGWDYVSEAQRIRDHGAVAEGGLATCLDSTVLLAAVLEHIGLWPLLVSVPGHIFVGYWRLDPRPERRRPQEWYPGTAVIGDQAAVQSLLQLGKIGVIETTVMTERSPSVDAAAARGIARETMVEALTSRTLRNIVDVPAARMAKVHPLPTFSQGADGSPEITVYRPGTPAGATVDVREPVPADHGGERVVDPHPPRVRTWKSALLSLNASSPLLNLKTGPSSQPVILEEEGLAELEDMLHQDRELEVHSGFDLPEIYIARETPNAVLLPETDRLELLRSRRLFVQRVSTGKDPAPIGQAKCFSELRTMSRRAKSARDEKGMNPLFLAIGMLRWEDKGAFRDAPIILVPVRLTVSARTRSVTLGLDSTSQVSPNYALIEWLKRVHQVTIPDLQEPVADRAGIDVTGTLRAVRKAVSAAGKPFEIRSEARISLLDLAAFRMWQDLTLHADTFMGNPLVNHLVHTPSDPFEDPAASRFVPSDLDSLLVPVPADSAQLEAVDWAGQGRSFVLWGPPGTGKSQTITNMIAHCISRKMRILFVAEKQTALDVVQRRLADVGLSPFMLNLHHEGSSSAQVRLQLKESLRAKVQADDFAMESALRTLRQARFELEKYPEDLHAENASGLSAYTARDKLLNLGSGPAFPVSTRSVAREAELLRDAQAVLQDLQPFTAAARVRPGHPWRLAGPQNMDSLPIREIVRELHDLHTELAQIPSGTRLSEFVLNASTEQQLARLSDATDPAIPGGATLTSVVAAGWMDNAQQRLQSAAQVAERHNAAMAGFDAHVLALDLSAMITALTEARTGNVFTRKARGRRAIDALAQFTGRPEALEPSTALAILESLIEAQSAARAVAADVRTIPGIELPEDWNVFTPGALESLHERLRTLDSAVTPVRGNDEWTMQLRELCADGEVSQSREALVGTISAWSALSRLLNIDEHDLDVWRGERGILAAARRDIGYWIDDVKEAGAVDLKRWVGLVNHLDVLRDLALHTERDGILDATIRADTAEELLDRGAAQAALEERMQATALDRFDPVAHSLRVKSFSDARAAARQQWRTSAPASMLESRESPTGSVSIQGLERELNKNRQLLSTRALVRRFGHSIQELAPVILASPASVVDLIEPGVTEFDVVIFDEASQITVPEAVGTMGRGRAVIVVGDTKQMPPTRRVGATQRVDDDGEVEVETTEDQESILSECESAGVPKLQLNWHYRSQDEALIAFSNRTYYSGELSSFPTPTLDSRATGVELRVVDGAYLRAGSRSVSLPGGVVASSNTNPIEAQAVVAEILTLIDSTAGGRPSIGVVTFNEQQKDLIENLLDASNDPRIQRIRDERDMGPGQVLFVKSLEQVQGDERDHILFSVAFSKQTSARSDKPRVPLNFGRLSNLGGERRLNVAVTRARRKNTVFCSFHPEELEADRSSFDGVKHLKDFLMSARHGGVVGGGSELSPVRDRHRDEIAATLRAQGVDVRIDVGLSDFRIDLLLSHQGEGDGELRPVLPVLLDGESWRTRRTVSDRDVLPIEVLRDVMGWPAVARVWWPMWIENRDRAVQDLLAEFASACAALGIAVAGDRSGRPNPPDSGSTGGATNHSSSTSGHPQAATPAETDSQQPGGGAGDTGESPGVEPHPGGPSAVEPHAAGPSTVEPRHPTPVSAALDREVAPYTEWDGANLPPATDTSSRALADALEEIVKTEGPITAELAYRRYLRASGGTRLGGNLRSKFDQATRRLVRSRRVAQIKDRSTGQSAKTLYVPGTPSVVVREKGSRDLLEVPSSEVKTLLLRRGMDGELTEELMRSVLADYGRQTLTKAVVSFLKSCAAYTWEE